MPQLLLEQPNEFGLGPSDLLVGAAEIREPADRVWAFVSSYHSLQCSLVGHQPTFEFTFDTQEQHAPHRHIGIFERFERAFLVVMAAGDTAPCRLQVPRYHNSTAPLATEKCRRDFAAPGHKTSLVIEEARNHFDFRVELLQKVAAYSVVWPTPARPAPPWPQPKSLAAGTHGILKQALTTR